MKRIVVPATGSREAEAATRQETLLRDLKTSLLGLSTRRPSTDSSSTGRTSSIRRGGTHWPGEIVRQITHPLALLLWVAAALAFIAGLPVLGVAILAVILLNAVFAFAQERQAERAVEALKRYLPLQATVLQRRPASVVDATGLVPGDVLVIDEGERISADARLLEGAIEVDLSTLTGESQPVYRSAEFFDQEGPLVQRSRPRLQRHDVPLRIGRGDRRRRRACRPSSGASLPCPSASTSSRARSSSRCDGSPG